MLVIPAIDLKDGRCVRLVEGREETAKVYDRDPIEIARGYESAGAQRIHVVDLDGAFLGSASENQRIIHRLSREIDVPLQVGGGLRSLNEIRSLVLQTGVKYVIIGTLAVEHPELARRAVDEFRDSIVVAIDARGRNVATRGWTEATQIDAVGFSKTIASWGVRRIIYTDITRDGKLEGPNLEFTGELARQSGLRVTASGGISSLDDIAALCELESDGVDSVVIGKALYEERFTIGEAISAASAR